MSLFFSSVSSFLMYLMGLSMRGMSMSLVNRPFIQKDIGFDEGKRDTQSIIDCRLSWIKDIRIRHWEYEGSFCFCFRSNWFGSEFDWLLTESSEIRLCVHISVWTWYIVRLFSRFFRFFLLYCPYLRDMCLLKLFRFYCHNWFISILLF